MIRLFLTAFFALFVSNGNAVGEGEAWVNTICKAVAYTQILDDGINKQVAKGILPFGQITPDNMDEIEFSYRFDLKEIRSPELTNRFTVNVTQEQVVNYVKTQVTLESLTSDNLIDKARDLIQPYSFDLLKKEEKPSEEMAKQMVNDMLIREQLDRRHVKWVIDLAVDAKHRTDIINVDIDRRGTRLSDKVQIILEYKKTIPASISHYHADENISYRYECDED